MNAKKLIKYLVVFAVIVLAVCLLAACGGGTEGGKNDEWKDEVIDDLPSDLNYDGEQITYFYWGYDFVEWELTSDGSSGDIVEKAISKRNNAVQERLGVKLNFIRGETPAEVFMPTVRDEIMSGSQDYDIIVGPQCTSGVVAAAGAFHDLKDAKYIDFTKPYWSDDYNTALSVNDKRYMIGGDASLTTIGWASCMLFDLEGYNNVLGDVDEFYQYIDEGNWTLDALADKCRQCYLDLNGNGIKDASDRYGIGLDGHSSNTDQFLFASGAHYSLRDENNVPVLDMKNDKTLKFADKYFNLVHNNEGVFTITAQNAESAKDMESVFESASMHAAVDQRDRESDFGIIPMPKLDDSIDKYHSWLSDNTCILAVPITHDAERVEMIGAVLEAMASETYRQVLPEYYERALKQKYARDSWSGKMLDLIHDGMTTDFVAVYNLSLNEIGGMMRAIIGSESNTFVSYYDAKADVVQAKLKELFEIFDEHNNKPFVPETTTAPSSAEVDDLTIAANDISSYWTVLGSKFKKSGTLAKKDMSDQFSYTINGNDEIEVRSPDIKICGGYYPTAAISSRETLPLADLTVVFHVDDGFTYDYDETRYSSAMSVMWTDKAPTEICEYLDGPGTNGLRECLPDDVTGLCISFMGTAEANECVSNLTYIIRYDGDGARPEIDHRLGHRFTNWSDTDVAQPTTIAIKEDDLLGYLVSVNGVEYRTGLIGEENFDIDLNALKDLEEGHLTVGGESNNATFINFTLSTINGKGAGSYFD